MISLNIKDRKVGLYTETQTTVVPRILKYYYKFENNEESLYLTILSGTRFNNIDETNIPL